MILRTSALLALLLLGLYTPCALACSIVYGDDWAFVSQAPEGWVAHCGGEAPQGTNLFMLPEGRTMEDTNAVFYVSVFDKTATDLAAFVREDQANAAKNAPGARIGALTLREVKDRRMVLTRIEGAPGAKHEFVAYAEGPNAYYLIVMSCDTKALLERNRTAFTGFLNDFRSMERAR